jgi:hypothetical protein
MLPIIADAAGGARGVRGALVQIRESFAGAWQHIVPEIMRYLFISAAHLDAYYMQSIKHSSDIRANAWSFRTSFRAALTRALL